jgi:hypothetical protein
MAGAHASAQDFQQLDTAAIQRIMAQSNGNAIGVLLDLNFMRLHPSSLDDPDFFKEFILLNNCQNRQFGNELNNEFERPKITAFYKQQADRILKSVPTTVRIRFDHIPLGQYDATKKAFPFVNVPEGAKQHQQDVVLNDLDPNVPARAVCSLTPTGSGIRTMSGPFYRITIPKVTYWGVPMDEAAARSYISSLPNSTRRYVNIFVDVDIVAKDPQIFSNPSNGTSVQFEGQLKKVAIFNQEDSNQATQVNLATGQRTPPKTPEPISVLFP